MGNGKEPRAKVIDSLRKAKIHLPDSDRLSIALACTLLYPFCITYSNDGYEEGTVILDKFLTSHDPGDYPSQYREALSFISVCAQARLSSFWKPEYLEEAIYRFRNWLPWIPLEYSNHAIVVDYLTFIQSIHFEDFGVRGLQEGHSCDSVSSGQPSFWDLIASLESPSMATEDQRLRGLTSASFMTDMAEIEQAIEPCRLLLASFHHSDMFKPIAVNVLGTLLQQAFWFTNNIEYINEAISIFREGLNLPDACGAFWICHITH